MVSLEVFTPLYSALAAAFPDSDVPGLTAQVFYFALSDIPDELFTNAVAEWLAHGRRFPKIADLRELALAGEYPLPSEAWGEVKRAFVAYGRHEKPVFSHPLIAATVANVGWEGMCASQVADESIIRGQFIRAYRELVERETFDCTSLVGALKNLETPTGELSIVESGSVPEEVS